MKIDLMKEKGEYYAVEFTKPAYPHTYGKVIAIQVDEHHVVMRTRNAIYWEPSNQPFCIFDQE